MRLQLLLNRRPERRRNRSEEGGHAGAYALLVLAPLLWSGNFLAGRLLAGSLPPVTLSLVRWLVATPVLLLLAHRAGLGRPPRAARPALAWMGLSGVAIFTPAVYLALHTTAILKASLLQSTTPVFGVALAALAGLRPGWRQAGGSLLTVAGVALILLAPARLPAAAPAPGGGAAGGWGGLRLGDLLMLLSALLWAVYTLYAQRAAEAWQSAPDAPSPGSRAVRPAPGRTDLALGVTAWSSLAGLVPLALLTAAEWLWGGAWKEAYGSGPRLELSLSALAGVLYVALGASVLAMWAWNSGVRRIGSARAISFNNLLPVFTALWGSLFLQEPVDPWSVAGGLLVVGGVSLAAGAARPGAGATAVAGPERRGSIRPWRWKRPPVQERPPAE
ncbi:MAG: DMT family transporter [Bacillota bacterium]|nr:DMT family transporter [Bacillota bacterium]